MRRVGNKTLKLNQEFNQEKSLLESGSQSPIHSKY